ncbi:hypothetical protein TrST_g4435 [Triparma strigata]|uniref:Uncharacterized protein n=1 Tax=Triparma strigata TaxID=1606541 RepID=A0A9W7F0Y0_9STRA|nr:hypothetical protein TrST_g4435 [Triparma strigata]
MTSCLFIFSTGDLLSQTLEQTVDGEEFRKLAKDMYENLAQPSSPPPSSPPSSTSSPPLFRLPDNFTFDFSRTFNMVAFGMLGTSYLHVWWNRLEPLSKVLYPVARFGQTGHNILKVLTDQCIGAVGFMAIFFGVNGAAAGLSNNPSPDQPDPLSNKIERVVLGMTTQISTYLLPQMVNYHWRFWPFFHFWNFSRNTLHERAIWQNIANVFWSALLSAIAEDNKRDQLAAEAEKMSNIKE